MSRMILGTLFSLALVFGTSTMAVAETTAQDSLKQGDSIGVFYVTKVAGAEDDGVEPGEDLCYRCRYGSSPMVIVFARDTNGKVVQLVKAIDAAVAEHKESSLKGMLTLIGEDAAQLKDEAGKMAEKAAVKNVPVVVAKETKTGPLNYKLSSDAAVTIVVAKDSQVVNTHTFAVDEINVAAVMGEVTQMLR